MPDILDSIAVSWGHILLGPTDGTKRQVPAFAHPGGSGLQIIALIDRATGIREPQGRNKAARARRQSERIAEVEATGIQSYLEVLWTTPCGLWGLRAKSDCAG